MDKLKHDKAAKIGDVLFRYMRARHRFKEKIEHPLPAHELAALIYGGKTEFDEIYIEPEANPPIVFDGKADDVFDAIINKRYRAIPFFDPQLVAAWRHYVIGDGPMPRKPAPRHTSSAEIEPSNSNSPLNTLTKSDDLDLENARCAWANASGCSSNTMRRV
jgi:hypothetical protein